MPRRYDPERRERLIDAALRIIELKGIGALSHRAVAAEADVPLGSTTYHFASLDDLLVAALERLSSAPQSALEGWEGELARSREAGDEGSRDGSGEGRLPPAEALTRLLEQYASGGRGRIRLEYELYLAALRRPALQPVAAAWLDNWVAVVARQTGDVERARALVALMDGLLLQALLTDRPLDRTRARQSLARLHDWRRPGGREGMGEGGGGPGRPGGRARTARGRARTGSPSPCRAG